MAAGNDSFDAIVVGTGISGGWAAKELTEKGLKTLVLDRGRMVKHGEYPTAMEPLWDLPYAGRPTQADLEQQMVAERGGVLTQATKHWFVNDNDHPYIEKQPFAWVRGYHVGGRSIMWGRQSYRLSPMDFEANAKEGIGVDWPIRYADLAPWYDRVESFIGVSGQAEGYEQLPDGKFQPPMAMNCVELHLKQAVADKLGRALTIGRTANLTAPLAHSPQRGTCQYRNLCIRGCPFGAYFSSNSSTLPAAEQTGNMTLRPNSIVYEIIHDPNKDRASGVRVLDAETNAQMEFHAKVIFLCASTFGSTFILMNSVQPVPGRPRQRQRRARLQHHGPPPRRRRIRARRRLRRPVLQRPAAQRHLRPALRQPRQRQAPVPARLRLPGRRMAAGLDPAARGFHAGRGPEDQGAVPGPWQVGLGGFGETLPYHDNRVTLDRTRKDKHGLAVLAFDATMRENELKMRKDMAAEAATMLEAAGFKNVHPHDSGDELGMGIHEMGTARMGRDPDTSVLNAWNQVHACKNVYVTDGAGMTSSACQNPSLTYMALTARAADHAVQELKRMNL